MEHGTILLPVSIAEQPLAVPVDIALRITVIIAILPVRGASTAIPSTAEAKPAPAAVRQPMTMLTTAIPMVHGPERMIRSISARKPAQLAKHPVKNTPTMWMPTVTASATIAARPSA